MDFEIPTLKTSTSARILIIGNGFDLACGYKVSYADFLKSDEFTQLSSDRSNSLVQFINDRRSGDQNWCDLEGCLYEWVDSLYNGMELRSNKSINFLRQRQSFDGLKKSIDGFIENRLGFERINDLNKRLLYLIRAWTSDTECFVFDFNYTDNFLQHFKYVWPKPEMYVGKEKRYFRMHGSLADRNTIYGTHDEDSERPPKEMRFILKSHSSDYSAPDFERYVLDASEIDIFGHSLGTSDKDYFIPLFDYMLSGNGGNPKIRIYTKDSASSESIRSQITDFTNGQTGILIRRGLNIIQVEEMNDSEFIDRLRDEYDYSE